MSRLDEIYASIPKLRCKGLCTSSCGPIMFGKEESGRITQILGKPLEPVGENLTCKALACGQCMIYENRPLICRLFGNVKLMKCPFGCEPEQWVSEKDSRQWIQEAAKEGTVTTL